MPIPDLACRHGLALVPSAWPLCWPAAPARCQHRCVVRAVCVAVAGVRCACASTVACVLFVCASPLPALPSCVAGCVVGSVACCVSGASALPAAVAGAVAGAGSLALFALSAYSGVSTDWALLPVFSLSGAQHTPSLMAVLRLSLPAGTQALGGRKVAGRTSRAPC